MKKLLSVLFICVLVAMCFFISACSDSKDDNTNNNEQTTEATTAQELSKEEQAVFDYIMENADGVLPNHTRYECKGKVQVDGYDCCRFEFYSDEMYLGAIAKAYDEDVMFWDATLEGNYMYMVNDNGWYVNGVYVNAPTTEGVANGVEKNVLDDGISGQYTCNLGNFYITLYDEDYAGDADGYFRAAGSVVNEAGESKQYSIAGEFYALNDASSEDYKAVYVYENDFEDAIRFAFDDDSVYISDKGTHNEENYNLTGDYLLDFYY